MSQYTVMLNGEENMIIKKIGKLMSTIMAVIMFMSLPFIIGIMVDIRHQGIGCFAAWVIWGVMLILSLRLFNALKLRCQKKPEKR